MSKKKKKNRPAPESLGLPRVGVESHAHLNHRHFDEDLDEVLQRAEAAGIARIGNIFLSPEDYESQRGLFSNRPEVFFVLGIHPNDCDKMPPDALERIRLAFAKDSRLRAVGEIGLDYYWDRVPPEVQQEFFRAQLALARELDKPVVIHSRDADSDTLALLDRENWAGRPLLWHCFGADASFAREILERGWHISIPGPVTYKQNQTVQEAVPTIPDDRLLIETDCPYLTPEPYRGKRNEPAYVVFTAAKVAELRGVSAEEVWQLTGDNARRFFGLD
jgi:TatD DNase family protein